MTVPVVINVVKVHMVHQSANSARTVKYRTGQMHANFVTAVSQLPKQTGQPVKPAARRAKARKQSKVPQGQDLFISAKSAVQEGTVMVVQDANYVLRDR